ncbi:hypothetical protein CPter291_4428 [Collimonas pratensis]|uniref:Uncharacterized protein n=1 Tax=Collimonas pratensis TaxID=279113 RepID=A0ABN4MJ09_9BURK|nr:hypothetical protein CPter291_4428 [Collimonas pratensis]
MHLAGEIASAAEVIFQRRRRFDEQSVASADVVRCFGRVPWFGRSSPATK